MRFSYAMSRRWSLVLAVWAAVVLVVAGMACGGDLTGEGPELDAAAGDDTAITSPDVADAKIDTTAPKVDADASPIADSSAIDTGLVDTGLFDSSTKPDVIVAVPAATPTFTPPAGNYSLSVNVTLATTTPGAVIFYTTDGTTPTTNSIVYSAPIVVTQTASIRAFAEAPGGAPSAIATATYNVFIGGLPPPPPIFSPPAGTSDNDFSLALSTTTSGATICYTVDGSAAACSMTGACAGTSATYAQPISIDGTATNPATGQITVSAVTCVPGGAGSSSRISQTYTLQVAAPAFASPAPATLAFRDQAYSPEVSSRTSGATAFYTQRASDPPSCTHGTPAALPSQVSLSPSGGNQEFLVVGCKTGYEPSVVTTAEYDVRLNPPTLTLPSGTYHSDMPVLISDTANDEATTGAWVCATSDGSRPACTAMGCSPRSLGPLHDASLVGSINTTGAVFEAIACSPSSPTFANSTITSNTYTLSLDPMTFSPPSGATIPADAGSLLVTLVEDAPLGDEPYDFICFTTDGVTTPDCTCVDAAETSVPYVTSGVVLSLTSAAPVEVQAIGCLADSSADDYAPSPVATATYVPGP